jgi:hypothetical protein
LGIGWGFEEASKKRRRSVEADSKNVRTTLEADSKNVRTTLEADSKSVRTTLEADLNKQAIKKGRTRNGLEEYSNNIRSVIK